MKYVKKPIIVDAFKWTGGYDQQEDPEWIVRAVEEEKVRFLTAGTTNVRMLIDTLEGTHIANEGDYIIKGIKGELYPCRADIFELTYTPVKGEE